MQGKADISSMRQGSTLLEVLLAVMVMSFVLLIVSAGRISSSHTLIDTGARDAAGRLAAEFSERIIAHSNATLSWDDLPTGANINNCDPALTGLENDFYCFFSRVYQLLPEGAAEITRSGDLVMITIAWRAIHQRGLSQDQCLRADGLWSDFPTLRWPAVKPETPYCMHTLHWMFAIQ